MSESKPLERKEAVKRTDNLIAGHDGWRGWDEQKLAGYLAWVSALTGNIDPVNLWSARRFSLFCPLELGMSAD